MYFRISTEPWCPGINVDVWLPSIKEADIPAGLSGKCGVWPQQACCPCLREVTVELRFALSTPHDLRAFFLLGFLFYKDLCLLKDHQRTWVFTSPCWWWVQEKNVAVVRPCSSLQTLLSGAFLCWISYSPYRLRKRKEHSRSAKDSVVTPTVSDSHLNQCWLMATVELR